MGNKLVENVDDDVWRMFTGMCKVRGVRVGEALTVLLRRELEVTKNGKK